MAIGTRRPQALLQGGVLGVDGQDLARRGQPLDQWPADDQGLLVGQREQAARLEGDQGGGQAERAGDAVEHHVALPARHLGHPVGAAEHDRLDAVGLQRLAQRGHGRGVGHRHRLDAELRRLPGQQVDPATSCRQRRDAETAGVGGDDVEGLRAH
ncbi:hypothetical protein GCM10020001_069170 [Nonomuraea salmonea]